MKRREEKSNLIGPKAAARILGWRNAVTFKKHLSTLPSIRSVNLLAGRFYVLRDVIAARYPDLNRTALDTRVAAYLSEDDAENLDRAHIDWIGAKEAARILGYKSAETWKAHLPLLPAVKFKKTARGTTKYSLQSVFSAVYPEAANERLNELIVSYKERRAEERSERRKNCESSKKT